MAVTEVEERRWQERTMGCRIPSVMTSKEALAAGKSARRQATGKTSGRRCQR
uniref:Uncharacterized protein n=1 Tax=Oryza sativa subsp. japonica TaxID=39947 RepID=Q6YZR9_ORYSJ|nr:hypothetical protein [Oryza sativa Japonica Group]